MVRALTLRERECLDQLLSADFVGVEAFRVQARSAWVDDDSTWVLGLAVDHSLPASTNREARPVEGSVSATPDSGAGGLILWARDGVLSGLEYWWTDDDKPATFPDPSRLTVES